MMYTQSDIDILARTLLGEAEGETYRGKVAVAWVVVNRVMQPRFPAVVAAVCLQPRQFSCWNRGSPRLPVMLKARPIEGSMFAECLEVAASVIREELPDPTNGADHYFNPDLAAPAWGKVMTDEIEIGRHRFGKVG